MASGNLRKMTVSQEETIRYDLVLDENIRVNKLVGNRIIPKRIHVRLEHIRPSKCREAFVKRIQVF